MFLILHGCNIIQVFSNTDNQFFLKGNVLTADLYIVPGFLQDYMSCSKLIMIHVILVPKIICAVPAISGSRRFLNIT